jgi:hypothetical protein
MTDDMRELKEHLGEIGAQLKRQNDQDEGLTERRFAEQLRDELNRSRTRWYTPDELGGDSGKAA